MLIIIPMLITNQWNLINILLILPILETSVISRLNKSLLATLWLFCSINPSFDDAKAHHFGNSSTKISPQSVQDNSYDSDGSKLNALLNVSWNKNLCLQANFKNPSVNLWGFSAQGKEKINRLRPENTAHKSIIAYCIKSRHISEIKGRFSEETVR